jgi:aminopeptidase N
MLGCIKVVLIILLLISLVMTSCEAAPHLETTLEELTATQEVETVEAPISPPETPAHVLSTALPTITVNEPTDEVAAPTPGGAIPTVDVFEAPREFRGLAHPENLTAGDPYAPELGNSGYDVIQYILNLALDPGQAYFEGTAVITAVSTMDGLEQISLDFIGFEISEVLVEGQPATYTRLDTKLLVDLPDLLNTSDPISVSVSYSGEPTAEPTPYLPGATHLGMRYTDPNTMFVVAEPDGARYWFPNNDHPRDKAHYRFELTVPAGLTGIANGRLVEHIDDYTHPFAENDHGELYVWEHQHPMASAFATVVVGDYRRLEGMSPAGVPIRHYVFSHSQVDETWLNTTVGEMIDWMGELFGQYPFEEFGYVSVPASLGFLLETQTMVIMTEGALHEEGGLMHELAHMWFGNWVSLDSWGEMWRSEGFATYLTEMWFARHNPDSLDQRMAQIEEIVRNAGSSHPLRDPPPELLFGLDVYLKGALMAHALRQEIGEEAFFSGLRRYFELYGGSTASDADFQAVLEQTAGISLDQFFSHWLE